MERSCPCSRRAQRAANRSRLVISRRWLPWNPAAVTFAAAHSVHFSTTYCDDALHRVPMLALTVNAKYAYSVHKWQLCDKDNEKRNQVHGVYEKELSFERRAVHRGQIKEDHNADEKLS
jgi:hypothetical protein